MGNVVMMVNHENNVLIRIDGLFHIYSVYLEDFGLFFSLFISIQPQTVLFKHLLMFLPEEISEN